ncbi:magnesium chelatase [Roseobacter cerasinus]|uniref:Magnesium chelatase n=1 Tax=Roseobacter cerasinus TaxID=2602289 RepID=A0A640VN27_9RHOB|nr:magnesium chelatase [Roseobacter cerasinus]
MQEVGEGPLVLMLHGAGGSTHSFRGLITALCPQFRIVALDLPGQGFTQLGARHRCGLEPMVQDITALCQQEGWAPTAIIGHSAGSALALRLSQTLTDPQGQAPDVIGINPALDTFDGLAGVLFPAIAKMLAAVPFTASLFSATSSTPARVQSLIRGTGSELDKEGLRLYQRLVANRDHVDGTLLMMSQWSLDGLLKSLPEIATRTLFVIGTEDRTVPPRVARAAAPRLKNAEVVELEGYGHLVHEEAPDRMATEISRFLHTQDK